MSDNQPTIQALGAEIRRRLTPLYGPGEAKAMTSLIFLALKGWGATQLAINYDLPAQPSFIAQVDAVLSRLEKQEPIQYVLGTALFHGLELKVTPAVLIPRPETAVLVDIIADNAGDRPDLRVLDLGTGSGCIAIALARILKFPEITAVDISPDALEVARGNARALKANISFLQADMRTLSLPDSSFDIVVSNPPYIVESEKRDMESNVLDHEPALALFVPDSDPLEFYKPIGLLAIKALAPGGYLYLEINPMFASRLSDFLKATGFSDIRVVLDSFGKKRFITCRRPDED